jgi:hypothetical protein
VLDVSHHQRVMLVEATRIDGGDRRKLAEDNWLEGRGSTSCCSTCDFQVELPDFEDHGAVIVVGKSSFQALEGHKDTASIQLPDTGRSRAFHKFAILKNKQNHYRSLKRETACFCREPRVWWGDGS